MKKTNMRVAYPTTADRHYGRLLYDAMWYKLAWLGHRALFYSQGKVGVTAKCLQVLMYLSTNLSLISDCYTMTWHYGWFCKKKNSITYKRIAASSNS